MTADPGFEATRSIREKISREHGNDPRRLVECYIKYQEQFADQLRHAPASDVGAGDCAGPMAGPDVPTLLE